MCLITKEKQEQIDAKNRKINKDIIKCFIKQLKREIGLIFVRRNIQWLVFRICDLRGKKAEKKLRWRLKQKLSLLPECDFNMVCNCLAEYRNKKSQ